MECYSLRVGSQQTILRNGVRRCRNTGLDPCSSCAQELYPQQSSLNAWTPRCSVIQKQCIYLITSFVERRSLLSRILCLLWLVVRRGE